MKRIILLSLAGLALLIAPLSSEAAMRSSWYGGWYWNRPVYTIVPARARDTGELKFDTNAKDAGVYINGAYAGTVNTLKTVSLRSGSYDIDIRSTNGGEFEQKVFVPVGKKIVIEPVFTATSK